MNLETSVAPARRVRGRRAATRLSYNTVEYELALGDPPRRLERLAEEALAIIEHRSLGIKQPADREVDRERDVVEQHRHDNTRHRSAG